MKKLIFLTPLAILGLLCLLVMTPTIWASNGNNLTVTMDGNNTALTMMATTGNNDDLTTTALNTGPADLLPVRTAVTLNEEKNRLFLANTSGLPQVDFNNNLTAIENGVLNPGGQNPAFGNNGDSKMKMLMLSSCENFGQALEEKAAVANDKTANCILTSAERNVGTTNGGGGGNANLEGSVATVHCDGALRAKIPKAAPSNREGIFNTIS